MKFAPEAPVPAAAYGFKHRHKSALSLSHNNRLRYSKLSVQADNVVLDFSFVLQFYNKLFFKRLMEKMLSLVSVNWMKSSKLNP